jgi:hypothetical protein
MSYSTSSVQFSCGLVPQAAAPSPEPGNDFTGAYFVDDSDSERCLGCGRDLCEALDAYYGPSSFWKAHCATCRRKYGPRR